MHKISPVFLALLIGTTLISTGCYHPEVVRKLSLAFPEVKLAPDETIQKVKVILQNGKIVTVNRMFDDWDLNAGWDDPATQKAELQAGHFVSGLTNIRDLDDFLTVASANSNFDITVILFAESPDPAGRPPRQITLSRDELVLRPLAPQ